MTEQKVMLICRSFTTRLVTGTICGLVGAVPAAKAGWCGHHPSARDGVWRFQMHVSTYEENPQVFRSEFRPRLSYAIKFYCVWVARPRLQGQPSRRRAWRAGLGN